MKIGVLSQKGGSGKTTIALSLAAALAREGKPVLVIDADPQGTITAWEKHRLDVNLDPVRDLTIIQQPTPDIHQRFQEGAGDVYAHAIIDGPPRADEGVSRSVIAPCDIILIPVQPSLADLWAARETVRLVKQAQSQGLKLKAAFVLSRLKPHTSIGRDFVDVLKNEGLPLLPAGTHDRTAYASSLSSCQTIFEYEASGKAASEITQMLTAIRKMR